MRPLYFHTFLKVWSHWRIRLLKNKIIDIERGEKELRREGIHLSPVYLPPPRLTNTPLERADGPVWIFFFLFLSFSFIPLQCTPNRDWKTYNNFPFCGDAGEGERQFAGNNSSTNRSARPCVRAHHRRYARLLRWFLSTDRYTRVDVHTKNI